jgi:hypothetical protein
MIDTVKRKLVTVEVTQEDIDKGVRWQMWGCPVAQALVRMGYEGPMIGGYEASAIPPWTKRFIAWRNTEAVARWIRRYDRYPGEAKPARFRLPIGPIKKETRR